jgi:hypothetical protein
MTSRLERAVREVSDLRSFYLRLQKLRRQGSDAIDPTAVEEAAKPYGSESLHEASKQSKPSQSMLGEG